MRFNSRYMRESKRTVIKPSRFRKLMLATSVANILCFAILAFLVLFTFTYVYNTQQDTILARYARFSVPLRAATLFPNSLRR